MSYPHTVVIDDFCNQCGTQAKGRRGVVFWLVADLPEFRSQYTPEELHTKGDPRFPVLCEVCVRQAADCLGQRDPNEP